MMVKLPVSRFVEGNSERVFINSSLGCNSGCRYCYLPELSLPIATKEVWTRDVAWIWSALERHNDLKWGPDGTLFSFGCYSECWDRLNRQTTIELASKILLKGNSVQLATKREIQKEQFEDLANCLQWLGQLTVFVSSSTISNWRRFEPRTTSPNKRFASFGLQEAFRVPTYLYLKPVIDQVTIVDLEAYEAVLARWSVDCVVGETIGVNLSDSEAPVGGGVLSTQTSPEADQIANRLSSRVNVYRHSTEAVEYWRKLRSGDQGPPDRGGTIWT